MFWKRDKKPSPATPEAAAASHPEEVHALAKAALAASGLAYESATKEERHVVAVYFFGMASAHGMTHKLPPEQTRALAQGAYQSAFNLKLAAAARAVEDGVKATKPGPHQKMTPVLHAGIDGQAHFVAGNTAAIQASLAALLDKVRAPRPPG